MRRGRWIVIGMIAALVVVAAALFLISRAPALSSVEVSS
jgi:hypothetical protein